MGNKSLRGREGPRPHRQSGQTQQVGGRGRSYPLSFRLRAVEEVMSGRTPMTRVSQAFGVCVTTLMNWRRAYESGGVDALSPEPRAKPARAAALSETTKREAVEGVRREHPEYGTRRIRDALARFEALGVSETEVRRILHEAGLMEPMPHVPAR